MPLTDLPIDVLDALCQFVARDDLPGLARTAPVFHPLAQRCLYRRLALSSYAKAIRCLTTIRTHKDLARYVRTLSLRLDPSAAVTRAFVDLVADVLSETTNLTRLDLVLPRAASCALYAPSQHGSVYARLKRFSCNFPLDDAVGSFLSCLPAATDLQLGECAAGPGSNSSSSSTDGNANVNGNDTASTLSTSPPLPLPLLPPTALPNLKFFMGPPDAAAVLVPGRPLESVHLYSGELTEDVLAALSRSSSTVTVLGAFTRSLSPSVLHSLAENLPHLHHLRIMTMYHTLSQPDEVSPLCSSITLPVPNYRF